MVLEQQPEFEESGVKINPVMGRRSRGVGALAPPLPFPKKKKT